MLERSRASVALGSGLVLAPNGISALDLLDEGAGRRARQVGGGGDPRTQDARRERTAKVARMSRRIGMTGQWENPLAIALRDAGMRIATRFGDGSKQDAWMYGWSP